MNFYRKSMMAQGGVMNGASPEEQLMMLKKAYDKAVQEEDMRTIGEIETVVKDMFDDADENVREALSELFPDLDFMVDDESDMEEMEEEEAEEMSGGGYYKMAQGGYMRPDMKALGGFMNMSSSPQPTPRYRTRYASFGGGGIYKYNEGGGFDGPEGSPFAMTKEEQDKSTAAVLKGDKEFMKDAKREERKTDRTIRRTGGGAEGLKKLQDRLRKRAKRQRRRENRKEKVKKWMATHTLNPVKAVKSRGKKKDFTGGQGKNAGCQGAACGAASTNKY